MLQRPSPVLPAAICLTLLLAAGTASADEPTSEPVPVPALAPSPPVETVTRPAVEGGSSRFEFEGAIDDWNDQRPWRYGTQYLFGLTRGMSEAGIPRPAQYVVGVFTVLFDTANLPFTAIAGLFGS